MVTKNSIVQTIDSVGSGAMRVMEPPAPAKQTNIFGEILEGVGSIFEGADNKVAYQKSLDAAARAAEAARRQQLNDDAADKVAQGLERYRTGSVETPQPIVDSANAMARVQTGVDQGRLSQSQARARLEREYSSLIRDYPDMAGEIEDEFKKAGAFGKDGFLFRDRAADEAYANAQANVAAEALTSNVKFATEQGIPRTEGMTDETYAALGLDRRKKLADLEYSAKQVTAAQSQLNLSQDVRTEKEKIAKDNYMSSALAASDDIFGQVINTMAEVTKQATINPGLQNQAQETFNLIVPSLTQAKNAGIANLIQSGLKPTDDQYKSIVARWDEQIKVATEMAQGGQSFRAAAMRNLQAVQTQMGITAAQAAPVLSYYNRLFGGPVGSQLLAEGFLSKIPADARRQLEREAKGGEILPGTIPFLTQTADLLDGVRDIRDMPLAEAQKQIPVLTSSSNAAARSIIAGDTTPKTLGVFINGQLQIGVAAGSMQPGGVEFPDIQKAANAFATMTTRRGYEVALANPNTAEQATLMVKQSQGNAMRLQLATLQGRTRTEDGTQAIEYNPASMRWEIKVDEAAVKKLSTSDTSRVLRSWGMADMSMQGSAIAQMPTAESIRKSPDAPLQARVNTLNQLLDHMERTSYMKGMDKPPLKPREFRELIATGKGPSEVATETSEAAFTKEINSLRDRVLNLPGEITQAFSNSSDATSFDTAVGQLLDREGGYVADDAGKGPTNFGINSEANPDIDVSKLTKEDAAKIYKERYWDAIDADNLPSNARNAVFDSAVNQGVGAALSMWRQSDGDVKKFNELRLERYKNTKGYDKYGEAWTKRVKETG